MPSPSGLKVALISIDYPPLRTSAAVQMRDLAVEMKRQGHEPVVLIPSVELDTAWRVDEIDGVKVLRLAAPRTRDVGYVRRTLSELALPFLMLYRLRSSPFANTRWDLTAWYSPTIFFGPLVWYLKWSTRCRTYLILRDIFPEWALDLRLIRKGPAYLFFKLFAAIQYAAADVIGVQTHSNLKYVRDWEHRSGRRTEVLHNWQTPSRETSTSFDLAGSPLAGRRIVVYAGNMGVAQGVDILITLAEAMLDRDDVGFLFVGRGSEMGKMRQAATSRKLLNTLFLDEIDSAEIPALLAQCFIGLVTLDLRHQTHNIPGKFLTYLLAGLPVLARVNPRTDLATLINAESVGLAFEQDEVALMRQFVERMIDEPEAYAQSSERARALARKMFSSEQAVQQIVSICQPWTVKN